MDMMFSFRSILFIPFLILSLPGADLNASGTISAKEILLQEKYLELDNRDLGEAKAEIISNLSELWHDILKTPDSFWYPFDSLPFVGKIYSTDSLIRIYSWNLPKPDGTHNYFGFVQKNPLENLNAVFFELKQGEMNLSAAEDLIFTSKNWYGALYYEIIPVKLNNKDYYTLLALDLNNFFTNKKVIDVLYFEDEDIKFGAPVFQLGRKIQHRVIFEYSSRAVMSLRYDRTLSMIVHDHLSPFQPRYQGQYQYYGPDFSYDGFVLENNRWKQLIDINISN